MAERKDNLLKIIVEEYIRSAEPIGSSLIVAKYLPDLSSATIRNEMAILEDEGLIFQPHPSAGRVPTLAGYKYYLEKFAGEGKLSAKNKKTFESMELAGTRDSIKSLAKAIADAADNAVIVGFGQNDVYYTGLANLFRQPEFAEQSLIYSMSDIIDHLDEAMAKIFSSVKGEAEVLIGAKNPFGEVSSVVLIKYQIKGEEGLIGILGPNRMDYRENLGLVEYVQELLNKL